MREMREMGAYRDGDAEHLSDGKCCVWEIGGHDWTDGWTNDTL